jgi:threonyl-tRNA synthetase
VGDEQVEFAQQTATQLQAQGLRVEVDAGGDRLGKKIRNAEKAKIPAMAVIGAKEVESASLNLRIRVPDPEDSGVIASQELGSLPVAQVQTALRQAAQGYTDLAVAFSAG